MNFLLRVWGILTTIPQRLIAQWGLVLAAIVGLVSSISLILSIPLYADAVYYRILQQDLAETGNEASIARPPFAFLFHYYGGWHGNKKWDEIQAVDDYLTSSVSGMLRLPQESMVRYISTDAFPLFPEGDFVYSVDAKVTKTTIGFMSGVENHINILEGSFPQPASPNGNPVDVLLHKNLADEAGFQVGEVYVVYVSDEWESGIESTTQFPVRIAGIWEPTDFREEYWISSSKFYESVLLVPEGTFANAIDHYVPGAVFSAYWYFLMDGSHVFSVDVQPLLRRISSLERYADYLLPHIRLAISPADSLLEYQQKSDLLTIMLYAFSVPIIGLILAFIGLVSHLAVERQRNEIAVLRSRGASPPQVLGFTVIEGIILGLIALGLGVPVAFLLTQWISRTRSFMQFSSGESIRVGVSSEIIRIGLIAVALVLVAMVIPAIGAARHTILTYKQERGRTVVKPWWQRAWMDVLIFIPAAYGTYLLQQQGSIVQIGENGGGNFFENPLLFLVPALGIFAMTLFSLRLIQPIMAGVSWLAGLTKNTGLTLASRQLSRSPSTYFTPLIILILTVSLSSYTASLAHTLDLHLYDQSYYNIGADLRFLDTGDSPQENSSYAPTTLSSQTNESQPWIFIPIFEYMKIDGVQSATRFGRYQARAELGSDSWESLFYGVDRVDFPAVAYWREDFASESLGALMNRLAYELSGVLVSADFLAQHGLKIGDTINLRVFAYGQNKDLVVKVVGAVEYFPTWYPEDGPIFVGNLDYIFQEFGGDIPYQVLLRFKQGFGPSTVDRTSLEGTGISYRVFSGDTPSARIAQIQEQPERQGLFGFLFIGFATAALLTALAFLLYVLFSFRQRFIELGVLRASGLSITQMTAYLVWELAFLILFGGTVGTVLGYWASKIFIPFLQIGSTPAELIPPFLVLIDWPTIFQIYWMFGILFAVTLVILVVLLRRMKIFQAIKLGETV